MSKVPGRVTGVLEFGGLGCATRVPKPSPSLGTLTFLHHMELGTGPGVVEK